MTEILHCAFNQRAIMKYNLKSDDMIFIEWLKGFASYIKVKSIKTENNETFFWIKYLKVLNDLPSIFKNITSLQRTLRRLSNIEEYGKPLIRKIIKTSKGSETYFAFDPIIMDELGGKAVIPLLDIPEKTKPKDKDFHKVPVNPNVLELFKSLLKTKENGKQLFTNHTLPADKNHYNGVFNKFQDAILCLYEGRFLTKFSLDKLDEKFLYHYKYYLPKNQIIEAIQQCKGSWKNIQDLVKRASINYSHWFDVDTEQQNKDYLPRSIFDWIYSQHTKQSMFYICLIKPPSSLREADAETAFNKIHPKYRNIMKPLYKNDFDGFSFWNKINTMITWYRKYSDDLVNKDSNVYYWLESIELFLKGYSEWLLNFTDNDPFLKNIGIDNPTWDCYLKHVCKEHDISIFIPRSL